MKIVFVLLLLAHVIASVSGAGKSKASVALPKAKKNKNNKWKVLNFGSIGIINKVLREAKVAFCSELEALTLQMTRPDNTAILTTHIAMLASCINQDYEDPEFIASSISKFSRKYMEENVYTKIKSIMSIHSVFQKLDPEAQEVLINCISSLRQEEDSKYSKPYFDSDIQSSIAGTVAEMETFSLLKAYFQYVFEFLDLHTDRSKFTPTNAEKKLKRLCSVWRAYVAVAESSAQGDVDSDSPVFKQCADFISTDKPYILKQMQKVYNVCDSSTTPLSPSMVQTLSKAGVTLRSSDEVSVSQTGESVKSTASTKQDDTTTTTTTTSNREKSKKVSIPATTAESAGKKSKSISSAKAVSDGDMESTSKPKKKKNNKKE